MALTTCPDCGCEVSDQAPTCLGCGRPMKSGQPVQVIEATGKKYKLMQVIGLPLFFIGVIACIGGGGIKGPAMIPLGIGGVLYLAGKYGAWWHHG